MRLFRSEEHVQAWSAKSGIATGAVFPVSALWTLARLWFHDRLSPEWRRRTMDEAHAEFEKSGLTGPFWRLDA
jgi:hypothetical protein